MKKKFIGVLAILGLLLNGLPVYGLEADKLVTEAYYYTGTLYYCDAPRNKIVLKDVKPIGIINDQSTRTAAEAEYTELNLSGRGALRDGSRVSPEEFNRYPDSNVRVIMIRSAAEGIRVVAVTFL